MVPSVPGVYHEAAEAHIDATAWKVARSTATMPSLVRSEKPVAWETVSTLITQRDGGRTFFQWTWSLPMCLISLIRHITDTRDTIRTLSITGVSWLPLTLPNRARR